MDINKIAERIYTGKPVKKIRKEWDRSDLLKHDLTRQEKEQEKIEKMMIDLFKKDATDQEVYRWLGFTHPKEDREWIADVRREYNKNKH